EGGGFGCGRHESDNRGWCALVDVGGPDMEGGSGDFEAEADDDEGQRREGQGRGRGRLGAVGDRVDVGRSCGSEGQGYAVKEKGCGEGAKQEVLDGGLSAG